MARAVAKTLSLLKYLWIITTILFILLLRVLPAVLDFGNQDGLTRGLPISREQMDSKEIDDMDCKQLKNVTGNDLPVDFPVNLPVDVLPDLHVELTITQTMGLALIDGYRMHLTCLASKPSNNIITYVDMKWSGVGLLQSLWVQNSNVKKQNSDHIERKLFFEPWLDRHAGEYTCHVILKHNDHIFTMNKTYTVSDEFRGLLNSRDITQKFDASPVKSTKWFPNSNLCVQDDIWQNYAEFHASVLSGKQKSKYLIYDCAVMGSVCGGYGNRLHAITVMFIFALLTKRVFLLQMTHPVDINTYLLQSAIQWNHTPPVELNSHRVDLLDVDNFYANYKPLENALLDNDNEYDIIRVRINFGLFYYLVTMNDIMLKNLVSTFNLKTQYDVVLLYGCAFNYLFNYQPTLIQAIDSLQNELGLETGKFVALHVRSHIIDNSVFNPLHLEFPFQRMFECATMVAKSLEDKLNMSKVPIYFATDHPSIIEVAKQKYADVLVLSRAPIFHVDKTTYIGRKANNQYNNGMIGVLSDIEICSRAAVLVRSADSTLSEMMGAIHFLRPQYNLHPFYFYENVSLCGV